jgi:hypothetical protein
MRLRPAFLCMAWAVAGFGKDVSQPVKPGALELGVGFGYARSIGAYDSARNFNGYPAGFKPSAFGSPLRVKYGIGHGVDFKAEWDASSTNKDAGDKQGMGQPRLGIRYNRPTTGLFSTITLPFATGDNADADLYTSLEMGGQVRKRVNQLRFTTLGSYTSAVHKRDIVRLSFKPEIVASEGLASYCRVEYLTVLDGDAYWLLLNPGVRVDFSSAFAVDAVAPVTFLGRNAPALWSIQIIAYWTLGR